MMHASTSDDALVDWTSDAAVCGRPVGASRSFVRPVVRGRFLYLNGEKFYLRGVTYGTFRPDDAGNEFHNRKKVERDLAQIARCGFNVIRTYTPPPRWMLDSAQAQGLRIMVGLAWEQHVTFLDDRERIRSTLR